MDRLTVKDLEEMELRGRMAESVTLPIDEFYQLIAAAKNGLRPQLATNSET